MTLTYFFYNKKKTNGFVWIIAEKCETLSLLNDFTSGVKVPGNEGQL